MLYLGIDLHRKQLTVNLRNEVGEVLLRRQVSTQWKKVRGFLAEIQTQSEAAGGWISILEVCGFHDWLVKLLGEYGCQEVVLVQAPGRSRVKTDRRDAQTLAELLWINRERLSEGRPLGGLRRVTMPTDEDGGNRQLTALRIRLGMLRTRTLNKIQRLLLKYNLSQECPTKTMQTKGARRWLATLQLPEIDRLEMDLLLAQWELWQEQMDTLEETIGQRQQSHSIAPLLATVPGVGAFSSLALASRMDRIDRFARPSSLVNYWGLAPSCRNSGEATQRLGSITKQGSPLARFLLGQSVIHVLRRDSVMRAWYGRIKRRRGSKIARVAVMRRLTTILWHMAKRHQPYQLARPPRTKLEVSTNN